MPKGQRRNPGERGWGLSTELAQEMQKGSGQFSVFGEPREQSLFEFLGSCADGPAVIGTGNFPESMRIAVLDAAGVADGDVAVDLSVNQKDGTLVAATAFSGEACCMSRPCFRRT